jgi:hypothetical protein
MTTVREQIDTIQDELRDLIFSAGLNVRNVWFGDIDPADVQTPAVHFMLNSRSRNDFQVIQTANRIAWDLEYDVSCLYSGSEGERTFQNAASFVDSVYDILQGEHSASGRLHNSCHDINCINVEYGFVALDFPEPVLTSGGVIKLIIEIFEDR